MNSFIDKTSYTTISELSAKKLDCSRRLLHKSFNAGDLSPTQDHLHRENGGRERREGRKKLPTILSMKTRVDRKFNLLLIISNPQSSIMTRNHASQPARAARYEDLVSREQVRKGFYGLKDTRAKAIYLFTASTGLRKTEILRIRRSQVNLETRSVIPMHFSRKKRSGITFYNDGTTTWLETYIGERKDSSERLFLISERAWREIWRNASEVAGVKITEKILRAWFTTEMGELGIPDRFVDIFQGRAPRTVIAKHYTGRGLERLKRIYEKAHLCIL